MNILGIETSCDETAAAVVENGRKIKSTVVASQWSVHRSFRGVVPELASRSHVERINDILDEALRKANKPIHAVAVTTGPGLVGALLVGVVTARAWGLAKKIPVIGINHLEGHLFAGLVEHRRLKPPFLGLIASGGHTELLIFRGYGKYERIGATRDDAAGEAFDKVANRLQLPFPGGPSIDRLAQKGNPQAISFPRSWIPGTHDFSFSGIKTAVSNFIASPTSKLSKNRPVSIADICASFQEAMVDVLTQKTIRAAKAYGLRSIVVGGGVAANRALRLAFEKAALQEKFRIFLPDRSFCTDNAVMIASAGYYKWKTHAHHSKNKIEVNPTLHVQNW